jgi:DNA-binding response OmpR family regulator
MQRQRRSVDYSSKVARAAPKGRGPTRILIIDDDAQFARHLSRLLTRKVPAIFVDIAANGFSAGIKCEALRPDALTLDLHMPDINGFELCQMIRAQFGRKKPRIVALTGIPSEENKLRIMEAGADCCLGKTAPVEALLRELGFVLGNNR